MKIKVHNLLVIILIASVIASTIVITSSQVGSTLPYDPWRDINDDGKIDIKDVADVAARYGTLGDPINKTELLLELLDKVQALENQTLPQGFLTPPAYDSGWFSIPAGSSTILTHNIGTVEVFVHMIGYDSEHKIHQINYGGYTTMVDTLRYGAHFYALTNETITVHHYTEDPYWEQIRVKIWKIKGS